MGTIGLIGANRRPGDDDAKDVEPHLLRQVSAATLLAQP
jgi:hypothetical protein